MRTRSCVLLLVVASGCSVEVTGPVSGADAALGEETAPCLPNSTCLDGLACLSGLCVRLPGTDAATAGDRDAAVLAVHDASAAGPVDASMVEPPDAATLIPPDAGTPPVDVDEQNGNFATWSEDKTHATVLQSGVPHQGYLSFVGDEDFYKITFSSKTTVRVQITTPSATSYDLSYQLTCPKRTVYLEGVADGSAGPASLDDSYFMNFPMSYYLYVHDDGDDEADPFIPYTVTVTF